VFISVTTSVNIRAHTSVPQNVVLSQFNRKEGRVYKNENLIETFSRLIIGTTETNSVLEDGKSYILTETSGAATTIKERLCLICNIY